MKKSVSPLTVVLVIAIVVALGALIYVQASKPKPTQDRVGTALTGVKTGVEKMPAGELAKEKEAVKAAQKATPQPAETP